MNTDQPVLGSVSHFLVVLGSHLTQYDQKQRDHNIYRLGHLLDALNKVKADVKGVLSDNDDRAMDKLDNAIRTRFIVEEHRGEIIALPPVKRILKQIGEWKTDKKPPKITVQKK